MRCYFNIFEDQVNVTLDLYGHYLIFSVFDMYFCILFYSFKVEKCLVTPASYCNNSLLFYGIEVLITP